MSMPRWAIGVAAASCVVAADATLYFTMRRRRGDTDIIRLKLAK